MLRNDRANDLDGDDWDRKGDLPGSVAEGAGPKRRKARFPPRVARDPHRC
jgi:hypothetical protein